MAAERQERGTPTKGWLAGPPWARPDGQAPLPSAFVPGHAGGKRSVTAIRPTSPPAMTTGTRPCSCEDRGRSSILLARSGVNLDLEAPHVNDPVDREARVFPDGNRRTVRCRCDNLTHSLTLPDAHDRKSPHLPGPPKWCQPDPSGEARVDSMSIVQPQAPPPTHIPLVARGRQLRVEMFFKVRLEVWPWARSSIGHGLCRCGIPDFRPGKFALDEFRRSE